MKFNGKIPTSDIWLAEFSHRCALARGREEPSPSPLAQS